MSEKDIVINDIDAGNTPMSGMFSEAGLSERNRKIESY